MQSIPAAVNKAARNTTASLNSICADYTFRNEVANVLMLDLLLYIQTEDVYFQRQLRTKTCFESVIVVSRCVQ